MKKLFYISESQTAIQTWYYEVVAETEEEAIALIENGDVECVDYEIDNHMYDDREFDVYDEKELNDTDNTEQA